MATAHSNPALADCLAPAKNAFVPPEDEPLTLRFGLETLGDLLAKVHRERDRLVAAIRCQDDTHLADALFNFAITAYHVRDWLLKEPTPGLTRTQLTRYLAHTEVLRICQDLCNAGKHRYLTRWASSAWHIERQGPHVTLFLLHDRRYDLETFADAVIRAWETFLHHHPLLAARAGVPLNPTPAETSDFSLWAATACWDAVAAIEARGEVPTPTTLRQELDPPGEDPTLTPERLRQGLIQVWYWRTRYLVRLEAEVQDLRQQLNQSQRDLAKSQRILERGANRGGQQS